MDDNQFLKQIFKPENFSKDEAEIIFSQFKKVEFSKNEYFIRETNSSNQF